MKKEIVPTSWKQSIEELRHELGETIDRWLSRLKPERREEASLALGDSLWSSNVFNKGPRIEMEDTDDEIRLIAELPGLSKDDFKVDLDDRYLAIRGEKSRQSEGRRGHAYVSECSYGSFSRIIPLPCEVKRDAVKAKFRNGQLKLTLPKTEGAKARRIDVEVE